MRAPAAATSSNGPANRQPHISGTPSLAVKAGESYVFQPDASDPDGDVLTYSWTIVSGPGALEAVDTARAAFGLVDPGTSVVQLTVSGVAAGLQNTG